MVFPYIIGWFFSSLILLLWINALQVYLSRLERALGSALPSETLALVSCDRFVERAQKLAEIGECLPQHLRGTWP